MCSSADRNPSTRARKLRSPSIVPCLLLLASVAWLHSPCATESARLSSNLRPKATSTKQPQLIDLHADLELLRQQAHLTHHELHAAGLVKPSLKQLPKADSSVDVIVVGAGWSGLSAARSLLKAGYSVAIFEARERVGGRSLRVLLSDPELINAPLWVDEGGQWFGPDQTLGVKLLDELGIERYVSESGKGNIGTFWKGRSSLQPGACWDCMDMPTADTVEKPEALYESADNASGELQEGLNELIALMQVFSNLTASVNIDEPWKTPDAEELDSVTFTEWVHAQTENEFARSMMTIAASELGAIAEPWWASALHIARQQACAPQPMSPEKWLVKGAAGQVPALLAAAAAEAGAKILLDSPALIIQHDTSGVTVHTPGRATSAKAVIMAMPPHLTGRVEYQPPLSNLRDQLVQRTFMGSLIKVVAVYTSAFWREQPSTNMSLVFFPDSEGAVEVAFDISPPLDAGGGGSGVLASFITRRIPDYRDASEEELKAAVLQSFAQFFGPRALDPTAFIAMDWAKQPFTGGAYSVVMPVGAWTTFGTAWAAPAGRIHWAGTEVSNRWPGFYEGAIHAANTAVKGVQSQAKPTGAYTGKWPRYKAPAGSAA